LWLLRSQDICHRPGVLHDFCVQFRVDPTQSCLLAEQLPHSDLIFACGGEFRPDFSDGHLVAEQALGNGYGNGQASDSFGQRIYQNQSVFLPGLVIAGLAAPEIDNTFAVAIGGASCASFTSDAEIFFEDILNLLESCSDIAAAF
jgi:hypothetical protein